MATAVLAVLLRGVFATLSSDVVSARRFLGGALGRWLLALFSIGDVISASVESALTGSVGSTTRWIAGASGAVEGGPAGRLAARRRRCVG